LVLIWIVGRANGIEDVIFVWDEWGIEVINEGLCDGKDWKRLSDVGEGIDGLDEFQSVADVED